MKLKLITGLLAAGILACIAQQQPPAADNTQVNQRDRATNSQTADRANDNVSDRELMQKIRKSIMDDHSLSTYAHNVKIIARHGQVTLKGPVRSEEEKHSIEQKAIAVAGPGNVDNQITVKPARS